MSWCCSHGQRAGSSGRFRSFRQFAVHLGDEGRVSAIDHRVHNRELLTRIGCGRRLGLSNCPTTWFGGIVTSRSTSKIRRAFAGKQGAHHFCGLARRHNEHPLAARRSVRCRWGTTVFSYPIRSGGLLQPATASMNDTAIIETMRNGLFIGEFLIRPSGTLILPYHAQGGPPYASMDAGSCRS